MLTATSPSFVDPRLDVCMLTDWLVADVQRIVEVHSFQFTEYSEVYTLWRMQWRLYCKLCTLYIVHCTLYSVLQAGIVF